MQQRIVAVQAAVHLPQPIHHATAKTVHLPVFGGRPHSVLVRRKRMGVVGDHVLLLLLPLRPTLMDAADLRAVQVSSRAMPRNRFSL
jgi:hypothetical protein